jgi:GT2 family glycosyltransferase
MRRRDPTVFVVIPVYNRLELTRSCVGCLKRQTYPELRIVVVDGGSTDGTVETLRREDADLVVLQGEGELWWTGAMKLGIEYALSESRHQDDMLLMMNNDTVFDSRYVETLVREGGLTGAAVGALIVDSRDRSRILDAGEFIDWATYSFPVKTTVAPGEVRCEEVDVLPGRGSLVPLRIVRAIGNVDAEALPHYLADYEFFARARRHGFRLVVTYETRIAAHIEHTGIIGDPGPLTLRQAWHLFVARKSMQNVRDHLRFIERCAPPEARARLKRLVLRRLAERLVQDTKFGYGWLPLQACVTLFRSIRRALWSVRLFLRSPYYIADTDCRRFGLDSASLVRQGILSPWRKEGWYVFAVRRRIWWTSRRDLRGLYLHAWNPLTKPTRWLTARRYRALNSGPR